MRIMESRLARHLVSLAMMATIFVAGVARATEPSAAGPIATTAAKPVAPLMTALVDAARREWLPAEQGIVFTARPTQPAVSANARCVVLVPGLLAREQSMSALLTAIENEPYPTGVFRYSSHHGIRSAANLLTDQLRLLKTRYPQCQVTLVTHSMGGLVARCCLEDPESNPGNVCELIMIAPPNHGSALAELSAADLAMTLAPCDPDSTGGGQTLDALVGSILGTAKDELRPDSPVLCELNTRSRAAGVRYSIIAGSGGPVSQSLVEASFLLSSLVLSDRPQAKAALKAARNVAALDEWTEGRGDGVVSTESARLRGVRDIIVLPFAHNDFGAHVSEATGEVIDEVLKRLSDD